MSFFCEGLSLPAVPHLGIYSREGYRILHTTVADNLAEVPRIVEAELTELESAKIEFLTLKHEGSWLQELGDFVELNLLFQPYIFFDAAVGGNHECTVNAAVYTDDSEFVKAHISNYIDDSLAINPKDINDCKVFTCIHPEGEDMCLSPNNAKVKFSVYIPVHIFYTLLIVPYKGRIVKALATKHILSIGFVDSTRLLVLENYLNQEFCIEMVGEVMERVGRHEGWTWYLHNVTWRVSGKPIEPNYGEIEWDNMMQSYFEHQDPTAYEKLCTVFNTYLLDLLIWIRLIENNRELLIAAVPEA